MTLALLLAPIAVSALLALCGTRIARRLPPARAAQILTAAALSGSLSTGLALSLVAFTLLARVPAIARLGRWCAHAIPNLADLPPQAGAIIALLVAVLLVLGARATVGAALDFARSEATCRRLGPHAAGLIVLDEPCPKAFAVAGLQGRVVVSTAMFQALDRDERAALLAHEQAHLRHRHHLYLQAVNVAVRANPLLRPLTQAVHTAIERWADEDAAATTKRVTVARAIARAALMTHDHDERRPLALGMTTHSVAARTSALLNAPEPPRRGDSLMLTLLTVTAPAAALIATISTEHSFEMAQHLFKLMH